MLAACSEIWTRCILEAWIVEGEQNNKQHQHETRKASATHTQLHLTATGTFFLCSSPLAGDADQSEQPSVQPRQLPTTPKRPPTPPPTQVLYVQQVCKNCWALSPLPYTVALQTSLSPTWVPMTNHTSALLASTGHWSMERLG
jgi:hypothetical protein